MPTIEEMNDDAPGNTSPSSSSSSTTSGSTSATNGATGGQFGFGKVVVSTRKLRHEHVQVDKEQINESGLGL